MNFSGSNEANIHARKPFLGVLTQKQITKNDEGSAHGMELHNCTKTYKTKHMIRNFKMKTFKH